MSRTETSISLLYVRLSNQAYKLSCDVRESLLSLVKDDLNQVMNCTLPLSAYVGMVREEEIQPARKPKMMKRRKEVEGSPNGKRETREMRSLSFPFRDPSCIMSFLSPRSPTSSLLRIQMIHTTCAHFFSSEPLMMTFFLLPFSPSNISVSLVLFLPNSPVHNPRIMRILRPLLFP